MSNILIIESCEKKIKKDYSNTSIVHVRNSIIITELLGADLITHESDIIRYEKNKYDHIICMYASPYMKWKKYLKILDNNLDSKLYWLVNDHDLEDNILLRQAIITQNKTINVICNNPRKSYRHWILGKTVKDKKLNDFIDDWHTVNLNTLIFNPEKRNFPTNQLFNYEKSDLIYYGTFRKYRINDLKKYNSINYVLSTSKKNQNKFLNSGIKARFVDRLKWDIAHESLFNFKYSIYVEDEHTHTNFAFMANRYYECLMCEVLMFFDDTCLETIKKCGYHIDDFLITSGSDDLKQKINQLECDSNFYQSMIKSQESNFNMILSERDDVCEKIIDIFKQ